MTTLGGQHRHKCSHFNNISVDSAYNIHGYKGKPVIAATEIMSQKPHYYKSTAG